MARARKAGIRPVMITGDHPKTAAVIAAELGITTGERAENGLPGLSEARHTGRNPGNAATNWAEIITQAMVLDDAHGRGQMTDERASIRGSVTVMERNRRALCVNNT